MRNLCRILWEIVSGEWLLRNHPNSGGIILLRAIQIAILVFIIVLTFINFIDPTRTWHSDRRELRLQLLEKLPWFGAILAAIYFALYARFASQWTYLANLYNQIKQTEARTAGNDNRALKIIIAEWKAGFFEDAEVLHLATKPVFASVIKAWAEDEAVQEQFIKNTPGGKGRFDRLKESVTKAWERYERKVRKREFDVAKVG